MKYKINIPENILYPDKYLIPSIRMSPFLGKIDMRGLSSNLNENAITKKMSEALHRENLYGLITESGREAISLALNAVIKNKNFKVSIITPSNSGYVSSCVTSEIEKYCSYVVGENLSADIFFYIHEFGRCLQPTKDVINTGKPVIEDCAYGLVDKKFNGNYGNFGDYVVYSLPKAFDIQYGGVLFAKTDKFTKQRRKNDPHPYLLEKLESNLNYLEKINLKRLKNYMSMQVICKQFGLEEIHAYDGRGIPHAFIVKIKSKNDQNKIKNYMNKYGIESSVFYGNNAYFVPCHQNLSQSEIEYIFYHLNRSFDES